jgi:hypothetical protein
MSPWDDFEVPVQARRGQITLNLHDHLASYTPKRPAAYLHISSDRFVLEDADDTRARLRWPQFAKAASPGARAHYDRRRETPATGTPPPRETSSTACSAASTTASPAAPTTTRKSPSPPPRRPISLRPLDRSTASDVWRNTHAADKRLRKVVARANVA